MKLRLTHWSVWILMALLGSACAHRCTMCAWGHSAGEGLPKNVILMVGDGMGPAQITAARQYKGGASARLALETMPVTGFSRTWSTDNFVTDSAAGGTVFSSGVKTYNSSINMSDPKVDPTGESRELEILTQLALRQGKSVGVVTTAEVTHATPACFYSHARERGETEAIALQLADSGLTLLMGGGRRYFYDDSWRDPENDDRGRQPEGVNLAGQLTAAGWTIVNTADEFAALDPAKKGQRVLGLFNSRHMQYEFERADDKLGEPSLKEMVDFAIQALERNPKGYLLVVEGARMDHAGHSNDIRNAVGDMLAFDDAIGLALEQPDTLVVLTADHETGGLALNGYAPREIQGEEFIESASDNRNSVKHIAWSSGSGLRAGGVAKHQSAYNSGSAAHTAVDVPVAAAGPGAAAFAGYQDNHEIGQKLAAALGTAFADEPNMANVRALMGEQSQSGSQPAGNEDYF